jgi:hypothetical protein
MDASTGGAIRDGSPDAVVPDAKPPAPGWCDTFARGVFCADFDRARTVGEGWTSSEVTAGAALELNRLAYKSPPQSMRSKLTAGTGTGSAASVLKKSLASTLGRSVLEFDCSVASIGTTAGNWALQIAKLSRNGEDAIGIFARSAGIWSVIVAVGTIPIVYDLPAPPTYGKFVRITFDVVWSPTAGSARVAIDGVQVLAKGNIITGQQPATKSIEVAIGLADGSGSTPSAVVSYDNVTLEQH